MRSRTSGRPDGRRRTARRRRPANQRERRHVDARAVAAEREGRQRLARATQAWSRLEPTAQFELVCELVETRSEELKRAYTGVLSVAAGHSRYRKSPQARRKSVDHEPAVTFLVERKWPSKGKARPAGAVPNRLWSYASIGGQRVLCAVPTDVEDARDYRVRVEAGSHILVTPPPASQGANASRGAVTCMIRTVAASQEVYLLSCRHVFCLTASAPNHPIGAEVTRVDGGNPTGPVLARVDDIYGPLRSGSNHNFDVALARLEVGEDSTALAAVLDRLEPTNGLRYVDGFAEIERLREYLILVPGGGAKRATFVRGWPAAGPPEIEYPRLGSLSQGVLVVESSVDGNGTAPGDSGAPVVTLDRTLLVGMHFAGVGQTSYMIPAYELVNRKNYVGFADGPPFVLS